MWDGFDTMAEMQSSLGYHTHMGFTRTTPLFGVFGALSWYFGVWSLWWGAVHFWEGVWGLMAVVGGIGLVYVAGVYTVVFLFFVSSWFTFRSRCFDILRKGGERVEGGVFISRGLKHEEDDLVEVVLSDRLGNRLFQYSVARLYAMSNGLRFRCLERLAKPFEGLVLEGKDEMGEGVDVEELRERLRQPMNRWAQNARLFDGVEGLVKDWLVDDDCFEGVDGLEGEEVCIHIRCGDCMHGILSGMGPLPCEFYEAVLGNLVRGEYLEFGATTTRHPPKKLNLEADTVIRIVTEDATHEFVQRLKYRLNKHLQVLGRENVQDAVKIQSESMEKDLVTMMKAPILILCPSTFSWWAGFLSDSSKTTIIYPIFGIFRPELVTIPSQPWIEPFWMDLSFHRNNVIEIPLPNLRPFLGEYYQDTNFDASRNIKPEPDPAEDYIPWIHSSGIYTFFLLSRMFFGPKN